jgi:hypothetical protein
MATLQERLDEAETALHDLLLGKSVVELRDSNGEVVRYNQASRSALRAYVEELKALIDPTAVDYSPMRPLFR